MPNRDLAKIKEKVRALPSTPGVYLMRDRLGQVLYVGKAKNLKRRVSSYFQPSRRQRIEQPKITQMVSLVYDFETIDTRSEPEALLLEGRLLKQYKPKYNTDFVDDKRFLLVRVDHHLPLPRFTTVRFRKDDRSQYFGPFAHSGLLRRTLAEMRRRFGILLGDAHPVTLPDGRWKLYDDARAEIYGHANIVTEATYRERVTQACVFLEGKSREWLGELKQEMATAAADQAYERAAELRDVIKALEKTLLKTRKFSRDPEKVYTATTDEAISDLQRALHLNEAPAAIECFDISHISGSFVVASMVRFTDGKPDKANYRRYRIRSFVGNDDFRAMEEVVGRRYRRLHEENRPYPELVVIDGGKGQVGAALRAFLAQGLPLPNLIGLAKRAETIIFPDERPPLNLPPNREALKLLMRVRDEAHRFANTFNADLRSKRMRETVLHDFRGLGAVRRQAVLDHFRNLDRVLAATPEELQEVDGIGPKLAAELHDFLQQHVRQRRRHGEPDDGEAAGAEEATDESLAPDPADD